MNFDARKTARSSLFAFICLGLLLAGCNSDTADGPLDTSRLPRVAGAKEVFASQATTIFTSPNSIAQTADAVEKTLTEGGWQKYAAPNTAARNEVQSRTMSLKRGAQALSVAIMLAPAQNNATSVQYAVLPLKTDLPFTKDASQIEYSPDRPLLTLLTAQPLNETLDFYRKELSTRGWSLWSDKLGAKQATGGPSGVVHRHGAYAQYVNDKEPKVVLVLTALNTSAGKTDIDLREWPIETLKTGRAVPPAPQIDVSLLPRPEGAQVDPAHSSSRDLRYSAAGSVEEVSATAVKLLAAAGWQQYFSPSEKPSPYLLFFKNGPQGLTASLTMSRGQATQSAMSYSPAWIYVDLPVPDNATDIVFDDRRPYLNCVATGTADALLDFYRTELGASGWVPLSATEAAAHWPNAKLDGKAYFTREKQKPIVLSLQPQDGGRTNIEIKVAPFALPQVLEAGEDIFGLPRPKETKGAGGTGGQSEKEVHAAVIAEVDAVLAFYRRELTARGWKEESDGAVLKPDEVRLNFTSPEGPAVLKIGHEYDLTNVSLVQQITKAAVSTEPAANAGPSANKNDPFDDMMKQAQQMMRDADALSGAKAQKAAADAPVETLRPLADSDTPVPLPDNAIDVEFNGDDGKLEFNSPSSVKSVAEFYRSVMKQQGWGGKSSVINNANMVVLDFSKAGKSVSFTIIRMGGKANVSAHGEGLKVAVKPVTPDARPNKTAADVPSQAATEDDLIVEETGGLPLPKRHSMSVGDQSPFRRALTASVPLALTDVLGFYRRELGKRGWKEESGAVVAADSARIAYFSAEGPGLLKLGRKDGETTVSLVTRNPDAAAKAGIAAKPGQAKLLITNPNDADATLTINQQTIKSAANSGTKGPDGATLELPPGKHKFSIKLAGKPANEQELEVAADETWGLLIGPGGGLPVQVY